MKEDRPVVKYTVLSGSCFEPSRVCAAGFPLPGHASPSSCSVYSALQHGFTYDGLRHRTQVV